MAHSHPVPLLIPMTQVQTKRTAWLVNADGEFTLHDFYQREPMTPVGIVDKRPGRYEAEIFRCRQTGKLRRWGYVHLPDPSQA